MNLSRYNLPLIVITCTVCMIFIVSFYIVELHHAKHGGLSYKVPPKKPLTNVRPALEEADKMKVVTDDKLEEFYENLPDDLDGGVVEGTGKKIVTKDKKSQEKPLEKAKQKPKSEPVSTRDHVASPIIPNIGREKNKKGNPYWTPKIYNHMPDWGSQRELKYIDMMHTPKKIMLKKDRKVIFPNITIPVPGRSPAALEVEVEAEAEAEAGGDAVPLAARAALRTLKRHFLHLHPEYTRGERSLDVVMSQLQESAECRDTPLFLTMATVGDELYWQLIENFVYTLVKFELVQCALVICVSDPRCMLLCEQNAFPCYNYDQSQDKHLALVSSAQPSVMEQIALLKLYTVPKALLQGVSVFMLDLDVGFLADPHFILQAFRETPIVDIFVQEDYTFIMNRTKVGWKSWFTEPLPNIGAFLCRGNNRTYRVFEIAYDKYINMEDRDSKNNPGKDQNHVLEAMRIGRGTFGLKYAYLTNNSAPLLDKLVLYNSNLYELGGELMQNLLNKSQAMLIHTTCYEKSTKVMGLKAGNAYWNPYYYNPHRRTLTKQLLYLNDQQILEEIRSLLFIATVTNRSLIIPNLLGASRGEKYKIVYNEQHMWPGFRVLYIKKPSERFKDKFHSVFGTSAQNKYKRSDNIPVQSPILEPNFYWRVYRDYGDLPEAKVVFFQRRQSVEEIIARAKGSDGEKRIVLHGDNDVYDYLYNNPDQTMDRDLSAMMKVQMIEEGIRTWANDSIGIFSDSFDTIERSYVPITSMKALKFSLNEVYKALAEDLLEGLRTCKNIFNPPAGNRTCFQICD